MDTDVKRKTKQKPKTILFNKYNILYIYIISFIRTRIL